MKTEFLQGLGLTEEQIKSVMAENGRDIQSYKTQVEALTSEKTQLESDKTIIENEKKEKEKALADLQKGTISKEEHDLKVKEIENTAKNDKEKFIRENIIDTVFKDPKTKIIDTEANRKALLTVLELDTMPLATDNKSILGFVEKLEGLKKTDSQFFQSTVAGFNPANTGDPNGEEKTVSVASNIAKEMNEQGTAKSSFFK